MVVPAFFDAVGDFFSNLAAVHWLALLIGLVAFIAYLTLRARASFHILRAAYPTSASSSRIWGAYFAAYGFNNVVPARGGDVIRLFLTKTSIPDSSYPAVGRASSSRPSSTSPWRSRCWPSPSPRASSRSRRTSQAPRLRPRVLRLAPALHAVRADRAGDRSCWSPSRCSPRACGRSGRACARARRSCATAGATSARSGSCSSAPGCCASRRSGSCSTRSTSAAR